MDLEYQLVMMAFEGSPLKTVMEWEGAVKAVTE